MKKLLSPVDKVIPSYLKAGMSDQSQSLVPMTRGGKKASIWADVVACLVLSATILVFFAKTVFAGAPISKICRLAEWDSIYSAFATGHSTLCDPSMVHLLVPHCFLVANIWHAGTLPLWNPYSACGAPLVGDIQATILSPMRLLFNFVPTMYMYNLTLVLFVVFAALFTYGLCRQLKIGVIASMLPAIAYALCPYHLFYLELLSGPSYCLFPLVFWTFARAAQVKTAGSYILCGFVSALLIVSGHPELSFFGIFFASLLMGALQLTGATESYSTVFSLKKRALTFAGGLTLAGVTAFFLSAPIILPFAEFLLNSDCYKYKVGISAFVPWQCVYYHLLQPGFGAASPYLGLIALAFIPLAFLAGDKRKMIAVSLLSVATVAFLLMSRIGPINAMLQHPPFVWLVTVYCMSLYLLSLAVLSGLGLQELLNGLSAKKIVMLISALAVMLGLTLALSLGGVNMSGGDFDLILPHMNFDWKNWIRDVVLAIVLVASLACLRSHQLKTIASLIVLVLAFIGLASLAKPALPLESQFQYPNVDPIPYLQQTGKRMISIGPHLLRANSNVVYGLYDLRDFNVQFPKGYLQFVSAAGAQVSMFNQVFTPQLNQLLDMASIRYVLSQIPPEDLEATKSKRFQKVQEAPGRYQLYLNHNSLPDSYLVGAVINATDNRQALKTITEQKFAPAKEAVVEALPYGVNLDDRLTTFKPVAVKRPDTNTVICQAAASKGCLLVLTDTFFPGWKAYVDGRESTIFRVNSLFRGVILEPGMHTVRFSYEPISFWLGVWMACAGLLFSAGFAVRKICGGNS